MTLAIHCPISVKKENEAFFIKGVDTFLYTRPFGRRATLPRTKRRQYHIADSLNKKGREEKKKGRGRKKKREKEKQKPIASG